jgi:uncharacterized membrane protein YqjE
VNQPRGLLKLLKFDSLKNTAIDYVETRIELIKAEAKDTTMVAMRAALIYGSIAILGLFFALFLSLTIALALNALLDSTFWGFAIVTGLYLIMVVTLFLLRDSEKVKMMFGDGSTAFLSAKPNKQNEQQQKEEDHKKEELEREAAIREQEAKIKHEQVNFEHNTRADRSPVRDDRPASIHVVKEKEE